MKTLTILTSILMILLPMTAGTQIILKSTFDGKPLNLTPSTEFRKYDFMKIDKIDGESQSDKAVFQMSDEGLSLLILNENGNNFNIGMPPGYTLENAIVVGFFELDGSNTAKEIVLAKKAQGRRWIDPLVLDTNGQVLWQAAGKSLLGVLQMDGDVCEEIIVYDPTDNRLEVHGEDKK